MKARGRVDRVPAMDSLDYPLVSTAGSWVALLGGRGRFHQPYLSARGVLPTNPGDDRRRRLDWASDNNEEGWFRGGPDLRLGRILARTLDSFPDRIGLAIRRIDRFERPDPVLGALLGLLAGFLAGLFVGWVPGIVGGLAGYVGARWRAKWD